MKIFFLMIFSLFLSFKNFASYIQPVGDKVDFETGDHLEVELVLSPMQSLLTDFDIEGKTILGSIYVVKVKKFGFSPNNHEAFVLNLSVIIERKFPKDFKLPFIVGGKRYEIEVRNLNVVGEDKKVNGFTIVENKIKQGARSNPYLIPLIFLGLIVLLILGIKVLNRWDLKKKVAENQEYIGTLIKEAQTRKEIEKIYSDRKKWIAFSSINQDNWKQFEKELNEIQFKENLSDDEINSLKNKLHECVRDSGV